MDTFGPESELLSFLTKVPLFKEIRQDALREYARSFTKRRVEKGYVIFSEGNQADEFFIVMEGSVLEHVTGPNELEMAVKERLPGDYFGEIGMLIDQPHFVTAITTRPTVLAALPRRIFLTVVRNEPTVSEFLLRTLAYRLKYAAQFAIAYAYLNATARLAYLILSLETEEGKAGGIDITQEDLALRCGLARQTVVRIISEWRDAGWIQTSRGRLDDIDRKALSQIVAMSRTGQD